MYKEGVMFQFHLHPPFGLVRRPPSSPHSLTLPLATGDQVKRGHSRIPLGSNTVGNIWCHAQAHNNDYSKGLAILSHILLRFMALLIVEEVTGNRLREWGSDMQQRAPGWILTQVHYRGQSLCTWDAGFTSWVKQWLFWRHVKAEFVHIFF